MLPMADPAFFCNFAPSLDHYINILITIEMKRNLHYLLMLTAALVMALQAMAAAPSTYYNNALGKSDQSLMSSLHNIVNGHYMVYYQNLWDKFKTTDCNGTTIIDRYSASQYTYKDDQCGSYSSVGDCYNREHSVPNSWWGADQDTMYSDLFHIYPVDGWVNGQRGNHPLGDCAGGTPTGTGKLGTCTHSGYTGTVFEVADEYKGDFARTYFYMVVRYMDRVGSWTQSGGNVVFTNSSYKHLTPWAISQLLEWHRNDPVSSLESARNEAVYGIQHNRNPFIDHPELAEYLWGNMTGAAWSGSASSTPVISSPANGSTINVGTNSGDGVSRTITVKGVYLTKAVTVAVTGTGFTVTPSTLTAAAVNAGTTVTVTYSGTATNATGRMTISSSEVNNSTTLTATYNTGGGGGEGATTVVETWEGCTSYGNYNNTFIQGHAFAWNTSDVGIWSGDTHCNDALSCRFGKTASSSIAMAEDYADGASQISFYAANWSSTETTPTLQVLYSTNGGSSWTAAGTCSPSTTWQQYIFNVNVTGNVRVKIKQTAGARLNIDDIAITSNTGTVAQPELTSPVNGTMVNVGTIAAGATSVSKTITVKGQNLTKAVAVTVTGTGFTVTPATLTAAAVNAGTTVKVTYSATVAGEAIGRLTISSSEVNTSVNLLAIKEATPVITISPVDRIEASLGGVSPIVSATVTAEDNDEAITLSVGAGFQISLNKVAWRSEITLDPEGEVFYVRLSSTASAGEFEATLTASTSLATAYADVEGIVAPLVGDVNVDGFVDISDVTDLIDFLLGGDISPFNMQAADVDATGDVAISDATALIDTLLRGQATTLAHRNHWEAVPTIGGMLIDNPRGESLDIYGMDGDCIAVATTSTMLQLPAGTYVVATDDRSLKVVVK